MITNTLRLLILMIVVAAPAFAQTASQIFDQATTDFTAKRYQPAADGFARYTQLLPTDPSGFDPDKAQKLGDLITPPVKEAVKP